MKTFITGWLFGLGFITAVLTVLGWTILFRVLFYKPLIILKGVGI
jgi:hypothetical protein